VVQKVMVVNDCRKVGRTGRQVGVEKRNESEPSEDASKHLAAAKTAGGLFSRDELGERSAYRPSGSRCIGGLSSTHRLYYGTREELASDTCRKTTSGENHEEEYRCASQRRSHRYER
jgi:hypothetical protein